MVDPILADHPGAGGTGGQAGAKLSGPGGAGGNTLTGTGGIGGSISETGGTTGSGEMAGAPGAGGGAGQGSLLLGPNLITNGDFSNGQNGWLLTAPAGSGITVSVTDGQLCVSFPSGTYQEATVGWPADPTQAVALPLGESFQFSFQASSAPSLTQFGDLVGPATGSSRSTPDFQSTNDALFGGIQMFSHPFTSRGDSAAGVAFNMNSSGQRLQSASTTWPFNKSRESLPDSRHRGLSRGIGLLCVRHSRRRACATAARLASRTVRP